jgi:hypothetical protein
MAGEGVVGFILRLFTRVEPVAWGRVKSERINVGGIAVEGDESGQFATGAGVEPGS